MRRIFLRDLVFVGRKESERTEGGAGGDGVRDASVAGVGGCCVSLSSLFSLVVQGCDQREGGRRCEEESENRQWAWYERKREEKEKRRRRERERGGERGKQEDRDTIMVIVP